MKKLISLAAGLCLSAMAYAAVTPNKTDFVDYCTGSQNSNCVYQVDSSGNVTQAGNQTVQGNLNVTGTHTQTGATSFTSGVTFTGAVNYGSSSVAITTATTSGNSIGDRSTALLMGANAAIEGSVLIASTTVTGTSMTVAVSTGSTHPQVVGVATAAASTGTLVNFYTNGFVLALTSGTVAAGDILVTTVNGTGYLAAGNSANALYEVGIAGTAGTTAGGLTKILLLK